MPGPRLGVTHVTHTRVLLPAAPQRRPGPRRTTQALVTQQDNTMGLLMTYAHRR
jgi:hypothetical protein